MASVSIHQSELDDSAIGATPPLKYNNRKTNNMSRSTFVR